ncbi:hypothetical protein GCM10027159_33980 [Lysobacter terrae]
MLWSRSIEEASVGPAGETSQIDARFMLAAHYHDYAVRVSRALPRGDRQIEADQGTSAGVRGSGLVDSGGSKRGQLRSAPVGVPGVGPAMVLGYATATAVPVPVQRSEGKAVWLAVRGTGELPARVKSDI